jgi:hypothetical protein
MMPEYVILFRVPQTGLVDGVLDDNRAELRVFDSLQDATAYVWNEKPENSDLAFQFVKLDKVMSTRPMRAAALARS